MEINQLRCEGDHSPLCSITVEDAREYTYIPPYVFMFKQAQEELLGTHFF
jgi:hypothetical protein